MRYKTRITFNSNDWKEPTGRFDKCQGNTLFEYKNGFGFEEWWNNNNFQIQINSEIYQFGFLQALNVKTVKPREIDSITLYTKFESEYRIVAIIKNVTILNQTDLIRNLSSETSIFSNALDTILFKLNKLNNQSDKKEKINVAAFTAGPKCKNIERSFFNFKVKISDIDFFGWEKGKVIKIKNHRFKLFPI